MEADINKKQTKSKKRVADYGEVFTNEREVNAMLDLVNSEVSRITSTVLEPACGEGAFVLKIFERKMQTIISFGWSGWSLEYMVLQAVASIYGVDIQMDNVNSCRSKLIDAVVQELQDIKHVPSEGFIKALTYIVNKNIQYGNTLTATSKDEKPLMFSEWKFDADGTISQRRYSYQEIIDADGNCNTKHRITRFDWMKNGKYANSNRIAVYA